MEVEFAGEEIKNPSRAELADELSAFANSRGGDVVLGVRDSMREVVGIPSDRIHLAERLVVEAANQFVNPPINVATQHIALPDDSGVETLVLQAHVCRSSFVHGSPSGYLRRSAALKQRMPHRVLARLFAERRRLGFLGFDGETMEAANVRDLTPGLVDRFRIERTDDDWMTFAGKLGMTARTKLGARCPTVAGLLLCSPDPRQWFPNAYIQAAAYWGEGVADSRDSANYQLDAKDITGPLDAQIAEACRFVARNQRVAASKTLGRTDLPQYDMASVFEGIVNAVAHRDYSIYGAKIRLRLYSNRLEVYSPGGLPGTLKLGDLPYRQISRNSIITSRLADVPVPEIPAEPGVLGARRRTMMDFRGKGVDVLLRRSEAHSGRRPEYRLLGKSEVMLTIFAAH